MQRILVFADYFSPAYMAGGPVKSLRIFVRELSKVCKLDVVTRDTDLNGSKLSCEDIAVALSKMPSTSRIFYSSPGVKYMFNVARLIILNKSDVIYINSFFSFYFSIFPLLIRTLFARKTPVVISPRGELTIGSLTIGSIKKAMYISIYKHILHSPSLKFHFTSDEELFDFKFCVGMPEFSYFIAPNFLEDDIRVRRNERLEDSSNFKIIYYSRVTRKKNILFFLDVLVESGLCIELDIVGHIDDPEYWDRCCGVIDEMPSNINVKYLGPVQHEKGLTLLSMYDLFILPTLNENFGHAILESLSAGTPVLISDKTPWRERERFGVNAVPLNRADWSDRLHKLYHLSSDERRLASEDALAAYRLVLDESPLSIYVENLGVNSYA